MSTRIRALLAALLVVVSVGSGLYALNLSNTDPWHVVVSETITLDNAKAAADVCADRAGTPRPIAEREKCWETLIVKLVVADRWPEFSRVMFDTLTNDNVAHDLCHGGGHSAGGILYERWKDGPAHLNNILGRICSAGLSHGYLIAFGKGGPHPESVWKQMAAICEAHKDPGACDDGFGHATMESDKANWRDTMKRCRYFVKVEMQQICGGGVVMDLFLGENQPSNETLSRLCDGFTPGTPEGAGCSIGIGYLLAKGPVATTNWPGKAEMGELDYDTRALIVPSFPKFLAVCKEHAPDPSHCIDEFWWSVPPVFILDETANRQVCEVFPDPADKADCFRRHNPSQQFA